MTSRMHPWTNQMTSRMHPWTNQMTTRMHPWTTKWRHQCIREPTKWRHQCIREPFMSMPNNPSWAKISRTCRHKIFHFPKWLMPQALKDVRLDDTDTVLRLRLRSKSNDVTPGIHGDESQPSYWEPKIISTVCDIDNGQCIGIPKDCWKTLTSFDFFVTFDHMNRGPITIQYPHKKH